MGLRGNASLLFIRKISHNHCRPFYPISRLGDQFCFPCWFFFTRRQFFHRPKLKDKRNLIPSINLSRDKPNFQGTCQRRKDSLILNKFRGRWTARDASRAIILADNPISRPPFDPTSFAKFQRPWKGRRDPLSRLFVCFEYRIAPSSLFAVQWRRSTAIAVEAFHPNERL